MLYTIITVPAATTSLESIGTWSSAMFDAFIGVVFIGAGIMVGAYVLRAILGWILAGLKALVPGKSEE